MFLKCIPANPEKYDCITWLTVERENLSTPVRAIMYILRLTKVIPYILNVEEFERVVKIISPPSDHDKSEQNFFKTSVIVDD